MLTANCRKERVILGSWEISSLSSKDSVLRVNFFEPMRRSGRMMNAKPPPKPWTSPLDHTTRTYPALPSATPPLSNSAAISVPSRHGRISSRLLLPNPALGRRRTCGWPSPSSRPQAAVGSNGGPIAQSTDNEHAPVGIRTRAPGSTGRDHRPLDHRGSGRRQSSRANYLLPSIWNPEIRSPRNVLPASIGLRLERRKQRDD